MTTPINVELDALRQRIAAAVDELSNEAQKIEDGYNADDYDGDLDADEWQAEIIWACCRKIRAAIGPAK